MPKRGERWSEQMEAHGVSILLYERPNGMIYRAIPLARRSGDTRTQFDRRSLRTKDKATARARAKALAAQIAEFELVGGVPESLTLGQLERLYWHHLAPDGDVLEFEYDPRKSTDGLPFSYSRAAALRQVFDLLIRMLGDDFPARDFGQTHLDAYLRARGSGRLTPDHSSAQDGASSSTVLNELRTLNSVFRWATGHRHQGEPLLASNPMQGLKLPKAKNRARPVASEERYHRLLEVADDVDRDGRLRLLLTMAWETGRRVSAILALTASDVALNRNRLLALLADAGADETRADVYRSAIRWRAESDKKGLRFITPLSRTAHDALAAYIACHGLVGDACLFPSNDDPSLPLSRSSARYLLGKAEKAADLPHQRRGGFHAFRRAWAMRRKHLPLHDVAAAGGWKDTQALRTVYQDADAQGVQAVVDLDDPPPPTHSQRTPGQR